MKVSIAVAALVAVVAMAATWHSRGDGCGARPPTEPALVSRADEVRRLQAPFLLPTDRAPRLELVGDSVADSFSRAWPRRPSDAAASFARSVKPGCGILPGLPTTAVRVHAAWAAACTSNVDGWRQQGGGDPGRPRPLPVDLGRFDAPAR